MNDKYCEKIVKGKFVGTIRCRIWWNNWVTKLVEKGIDDLVTKLGVQVSCIFIWKIS